MDQQGPGDLADLQPQRSQHVLAVPPGPDLVVPEPGTYPAPESPRVATVVPPGRQPGPQLVVGQLAELNRAPTASAATTCPASCQAVRTAAVLAGA